MKIIHHHFESIDSTNTWSKAHANTFDPKCLTLVTAAQQTFGKGRLGRSWISPAGKNIYATFNFFMDPKRKDIGNLPQIMAISAAEVIEQCGLSPKLKWPNDLLLQDKKVGGILTETTLVDDLLFVALGIGININMSSEEMHAIDRPVTSLLIESGQLFEVDTMLQKLAENFRVRLLQFFSEGFDPFFKAYTDRLIHSSQTEMSFRDSQSTWHGYFTGINPDGSLAMQLIDGTLKTFVAGELL